jgi:hypothetical protein
VSLTFETCFFGSKTVGSVSPFFKFGKCSTCLVEKLIGICQLGFV